MRHHSIPSTLTPENLGQWIQDNADSDLIHILKEELTEDAKQDLAMKSSLASRAIDRLEEVKKEFMEILKNGTPDPDAPFEVTVPPTKGLKILNANRKFADRQIENGCTEEEITIYLIPFPEESIMVAVDIEGKEWEQYTRPMDDAQEKKHGKLFSKEKKAKKEPAVDANEIEI